MAIGRRNVLRFYSNQACRRPKPRGNRGTVLATSAQKPGRDIERQLAREKLYRFILPQGSDPNIPRQPAVEFHTPAYNCS